MISQAGEVIIKLTTLMKQLSTQNKTWTIHGTSKRMLDRFTRITETLVSIDEVDAEATLVVTRRRFALDNLRLAHFSRVARITATRIVEAVPVDAVE